MPFTAIHPAAVLGLARWGLPPSALVIGSISPDLPMSLPVPEVVHFAHTAWGVVTLDLAVGLAVFVLWQTLFGPALVAIAPRRCRNRLTGPAGLAFHFGQLPPALLATAGVLIGVVTHVVWDSFTHDWMWGPAHVPWLAARHGPLWGWEWVRWASEAVGLAILVAWLVRWWKTTPERPNTTVTRGPAGVLAWLVILLPAAAGFGYWLIAGSLFLAITRGTGLGIAGLTVVAVGWRMRPKLNAQLSSFNGA